MLPEIDTIHRKNSWLVMNNKDSISAALRNAGEFATLEQDIAKIFMVKEGRSVIDVGANVGSFTIPIAIHNDKLSGRVYCFEPQRIVFQNLCANIFINRCANVYAYNMALGQIDGTLNIPELDLLKSDNIGGFSIDDDIRLARETKPGFSSKNYYTGACFSVEQRKLDNFLIEQNIGFVKVDIEGNELEFFKGATNTFERHNFPPILFEVWEQIDWYRDKANETKMYLEALGYKLTRLGENYVAQHDAYDVAYEFQIQDNNVNINRVK